MPNNQNLALVRSAPQGEFAVETTSIPTPPPGHLIVKVIAAALNPADWKVHAFGFYPESYPIITGFDGAGVVEEIGSGVVGFDQGDRV